MKTIRCIAILLMLICSIALSACNTGKGDQLESGSQTTAETTPGNATSNEPDNTAEHLHEYGAWEIDVYPTCEKEGSQERTCACGEKETAPIPVIAHNYVNNICTMCKKSNIPAFVPDYPSGQANTIGNDVSNSRFASQADWIYFSPSPTQISKFTKSTSATASVYQLSSGCVQNINVVGDWIYFYVEGSDSYIARVRTDGTEFEKILSSVTVGDMLVVKDTIFFTTLKSPYNDYAKDCAPLYTISVNGGMTKQIHDGSVSSIAADSTYVYFLQTSESGTSTIYRMKHDTTKMIELRENANINYFVLRDSKLYFLTSDKDSEECSLSSISTTGGSFTTYGKIPYYSEWLYIVDNKAYYYGSPYSETEFTEKAGLVEYNISTKKYKIVKENYDMIFCFFASDRLIIENYKHDTLTSLSMYILQSNSWKELPVN